MKKVMRYFLSAVIGGTLVSFVAIAGTNTIPTRSTGQTILPDFFNNLKTAITVNFVPRNTSGVATDESGDLGEDDLRWRDIWASRYLNLGTTAQALRVLGESSKLKFQVGGSTIVEIGATGLDGAGMKDASITEAKFAVHKRMRTKTLNSGTSVAIPSDVTWVYILAWGGGGGGAGGNTSVGGGGGSSGETFLGWRPVTPGGSFTYAIGTAGSGGAVSNDGTNGGSTTLDGVITVTGGLKGTTAGVGGSRSGSLSIRRAASGGNSNLAGEANEFWGAAAGGGSPGGGGGGAGYGAGGIGTGGSDPGGNGTDGAGGGGGGPSGHGGNGGAGVIILFAVTSDPGWS